MAGGEAALGGRDLEGGVEGDFRPTIGLGHEAPLHAEFEIAQAPVPACCVPGVVGIQGDL